MSSAGASVIEASDYVMRRLRARVEGLVDAEYFWEPVEGCWSLRRDGDGRWRLDGDGGGTTPPDPVPFTTVAWRIGHLGAICLGGFAQSAFGDGEPPADSWEFPSGAAGVQPFLDAHYAAWRAGIATLDEVGWQTPLGPSFGQHSDSTRLDLALHVLDEVVHHGAEVGVLRDLYVHRAELGNR